LPSEKAVTNHYTCGTWSLSSLDGGHTPTHVPALVDARDGGLVFERAAAVVAAA
jgi:hypothetical protein